MMAGYLDDVRFPWDGDRVEQADGVPEPECIYCGAVLAPHECGACDSCGEDC